MAKDRAADSRAQDEPWHRHLGATPDGRCSRSQHPGSRRSQAGFGKTKQLSSRLHLIWADGGYTGKLVDWVKDTCNWVLEIAEGRSRHQGIPDSATPLGRGAHIRLVESVPSPEQRQVSNEKMVRGVAAVFPKLEFPPLQLCLFGSNRPSDERQHQLVLQLPHLSTASVRD